MTDPRRSWASTVALLQQAATANARAKGEPATSRYNPRPAGVIRRGSATHLVLQVLANRQSQWLTRERLVWHTRCTRKSVDWALIYLRARGLVDMTTDLVNGQQRYRLRDAAVASIQVSGGPDLDGIDPTCDAHRRPGSEARKDTLLAGHQ